MMGVLANPAKAQIHADLGISTGCSTTGRNHIFVVQILDLKNLPHVSTGKNTNEHHIFI